MNSPRCPANNYLLLALNSRQHQRFRISGRSFLTFLNVLKLKPFSSTSFVDLFLRFVSRTVAIVLKKWQILVHVFPANVRHTRGWNPKQIRRTMTVRNDLKENGKHEHLITVTYLG